MVWFPSETLWSPVYSEPTQIRFLVYNKNLKNVVYRTVPAATSQRETDTEEETDTPNYRMAEACHQKNRRENAFVVSGIFRQKKIKETNNGKWKLTELGSDNVTGFNIW